LKINYFENYRGTKRRSPTALICTAIIQQYFNLFYSFFKKKNIFLLSQNRAHIMIQRVQTIFMVIATVVMLLLYMWFPVVRDESGEVLFEKSEPLFFILIFLSIVLGIISILGYKKRKKQFVLNRLNIISNFILLGVFVYRSLNVSGEEITSEKGIGMFFPILSIVFLVLANRAIQRDERLVKSVDRLR